MTTYELLKPWKDENEKLIKETRKLKETLLALCKAYYDDEILTKEQDTELQNFVKQENKLVGFRKALKRLEGGN